MTGGFQTTIIEEANGTVSDFGSIFLVAKVPRFVHMATYYTVTLWKQDNIVQVLFP